MYILSEYQYRGKDLFIATSSASSTEDAIMYAMGSYGFVLGDKPHWSLCIFSCNHSLSKAA